MTAKIGQLIFGFDIGTTSIGFAAIDYDEAGERGAILRIGTRIFPEARDPDGTPLNQTRRTKRMMRRQLRRRKARRQELNQALADAGLLPEHKSLDWERILATDPIDLRKKALSEALSPFEVGRALSHLSKRRHFRGKDLEESEDGTALDEETKALSNAEIEELGVRKATIAALDTSGETLGQHLARKGHHVRQRGVHALRRHVDAEFEAIWEKQKSFHPQLMNDRAKEHMRDIIFAQKPVFWRTNTLGECRLEPTAPLLAKGSWQSAQRRMLEKLNSLQFQGGNQRPLNDAERALILEKLQTQQSMTFSRVREAIEPLFKAEGESARRLKFNLENGGETKLPGNPVEAKLASIFGDAWASHPHKQSIRETIYDRIGGADYGRIGDQRVVILRTADRAKARAEAVISFVRDYQIDDLAAEKLMDISFPTGWDAFSKAAVERLMPELEQGTMMGQLLASPDWADWRDATFPNRHKPTGEVLDRLPSPSNKDEQARQTKLRNPTVVRVQNELRKVVNNLIDFCGRKPELIRIELARDVGLGKNEREERSKGMRQFEKRRATARADLISKGFPEPAHRDIEKWLLWKECGERCPYTGDHITFEGLFRNNDFEVEHIWPRSRSLDDSQANKTLCRKDVNLKKGNQTPFEFYKNRPEEWGEVKDRIWKMLAPKGKDGMGVGKIKRFLKEELPDDFATRQLNDTGYAARQAMEQLKRLWPDVGPEGKVYVQPVNGKVTAHLRKLWELNHILGDTGEKNRADHRHHAIDALVVACAHGGFTQKLSRYWQMKDDPRAAGAEKPKLPPPWANIRGDAERAADAVIVSHRVRKKVSGSLHKETVYGDTGETKLSGKTELALISERIELASLTMADIENDSLEGKGYFIIDQKTRERLRERVKSAGGDLKAAWAQPLFQGDGGTQIKKVKCLKGRQKSTLRGVHNGWVDPEAKHHLSIVQYPDGAIEGRIATLFDVARRVSRKEPIVERSLPKNGNVLFTLHKGDTVALSHSGHTYWAVRELKTNGQLTLVPVEEARPTKQAKNYKPTAPSFVKLGARKVSIDPIGRVRPAND
jgi:CRISPR-associated endonuclease Csn1